jgi:hypothetical protein
MTTFKNYESWVFTNGIVGDVFFSQKSERTLTASAGYYNRKITTERIVAVSGTREAPEATSIVKVTILQ